MGRSVPLAPLGPSGLWPRSVRCASQGVGGSEIPVKRTGRIGAFCGCAASHSAVLQGVGDSEIPATAEWDAALGLLPDGPEGGEGKRTTHKT